MEESGSSLEDEMREVSAKDGAKDKTVEEGNDEEGKEKDEELEEDDSLEWDLRNTDSVFSELSELSRDYVESVDQGASIRGEPTSPLFLSGGDVHLTAEAEIHCYTKCPFYNPPPCAGSADQFEEILSQYEELKVTQ